MNINNFLQECVDNGWGLDTDDIEHILNLDFKYVRDCNAIEVVNQVKEVIKDATYAVGGRKKMAEKLKKIVGEL